MKAINNYISEKLHLNKDIELSHSNREIFVHMMGCMGFKGFTEEHIKEKDKLTKEVYKWLDKNGITSYPKYYVNKDHAIEAGVSNEYLEKCVDDPQVISDILDYLLSSNEKAIDQTASMEVYKFILKDDKVPEDIAKGQEGLFIYQKLLKFGALFCKDDNN